MPVLIHEIVHALGTNHPNPEHFPDSIMNIPAESRDEHILYPLDREALLAVYGHLQPGDGPTSFAEDLGAWESSSYHVQGEIEALEGAAFGVARRNGLAQAWASGPAPWSDLADNQQLAGSASWTGAMIGFDLESGAHVLSDADLEIDLGTLDGTLDFTAMEAWASATDIATGTGTKWGDGDLAYTVGVRGNTFTRTGGDDGIVTGVFFGSRHEGMGGTLERDDLVGGFSGSR